MDTRGVARACRWKIREEGLVNCINWAIASGELPLDGGPRWRLKRLETTGTGVLDPKYVLVAEHGDLVRPVQSVIELGIRAGCLEDRGEQNARYEVILCDD